jgi:hypothetical protein
VFREKKNYILIQQVERRWSNAAPHHHQVNNANNNGGGDRKTSSRSGARSFFQQERTKSLCAFQNSSILNYARAMAENKRFNREKTSSREVAILNAAAATANATGGGGGGGGGTTIPKDLKILQYHEKIMEIQNKWTGNGKFIIREKSTFLVLLVYFKKNKFIIFFCSGAILI